VHRFEDTPRYPSPVTPSVAHAGRRRLELALDYRCNQRCLGCRACHDTGERVPPERAAALLREARAAGVSTAWFGGGEPTLRVDLLALVRYARTLGFDSVCVQTNALRLAYPDYAAALVEAGVTEIRVNAKSHRAEVHDRLSGLEGAHALLVRALGNLASSGAAAAVHVVADILLARATIDELPETVAYFADRGVRGFALWLLSASDAGGADDVAAEVPRIADAVPAIERAAGVAGARGVALVSFHTPPCTLPGPLRALWLPARDLAMTVVDAGGHAFPLESSSFEGGAFVEACASCVARGRCGGPRSDYLRIHGAAEFRPLSRLDAQ
jgi:cyclic pyranopterin phosphate synthase